MGKISIEKEKPTPSKGPFPRGARVVLAETDAMDREAGFRAGMAGVVIESGETPTVRMDRAVKGERVRTFIEYQLVLERYYKPRRKEK